MGLVPIGANPVTGLWEFYELRSAWDGTSDPAAMPIPTLRPDGSIEMTGDTGIVFVLLAGGTFRMGAQATDAKAPSYDPQAFPNEAPVHAVQLASFFLARYEMTQGQWKRLSGGEEPSWNRIGVTYDGNPERVGYTNPVEQVDWTMCDRLPREFGLVLPTEAQWECGCRAGAATPWWPGPTAHDLAGCANVLDRSAERVVPEWGRSEGDFDDGRVNASPVGVYRGNAFGLYDVHGNVWEWCRDSYGSYSIQERAGDGLRQLTDGDSRRPNRGGAFYLPASGARSSSRNFQAPTFRGPQAGVRPARALHPDIESPAQSASFIPESQPGRDVAFGSLVSDAYGTQFAGDFE